MTVTVLERSKHHQCLPGIGQWTDNTELMLQDAYMVDSDVSMRCCTLPLQYEREREGNERV